MSFAWSTASCAFWRTVSSASGTTFKFENNTDTVKIKTDGVTDTTLKVTAGSNITLEDQQGATFGTTTIDGGRLNASIWQDTSTPGQNDNAFKDVTVTNGGIFNITKLNSGGDKDTPHNRLLLKNGLNLTLDGGKLYVAGSEFTGKLKVGTASGTESSLTLKNASMSLEQLEVGGVGKVTLQSNGSIETDKLVLSKGNVVVDGGSLTVTDKTGFTIVTGKRDPKLNIINGGSLTVDASSIFGESALTNAGKTLEGNGIVNITDTFDYTLDDLKKAQNLLNGVTSGSTQEAANTAEHDLKLVFVNGTLKEVEGGLTADKVDGLVLADKVVTADSGSATFNSSTTLAGINFDNKTASGQDTSVTISGSGALTLVGDADGNIFQGLANSVVTVSAKKLVLGTSAASEGTVNVNNLKVDALTVKGAYTATNIELSSGSGFEVADGASLTTEKLTGEGELEVTGTLAANRIEADVKTAANGTLVIGARLDQPASAAAFFSTSQETLLPQIAGDVKVQTSGSIAATNANGKALFDAALERAGQTFDDTKNVGLYVDGTIAVDAKKGKLTVGTLQSEKESGSVAIGSNTMVVIDTTKFATADDVAFNGQLYLSGDAPVVLDGVTTAKTFTLSTSNGSTDAKPGINLIDNNALLTGSVTKDAGTTATTITIAFNEGAVKDEDLRAVLKTQLDGKHNQKTADVLAGIANTEGNYGFVTEDGKQLTDLGESAAMEYLVAPVTAGVYNVAYDAAAEVTGAMARRITSQDAGTGLWADVFYTSNKDNEIFGGQGYSADIYGGVLGFDTTFSCGAKLGLAVTVGTSDSDSERSVSKFSNDGDFYGVSLYTGRGVGDTSLYLSADATYLAIDNDLKGTVAGVSANESLDSSVFTIGVRADWTAYEGAFKVAPHVGLRYTNIDVDNYRGNETSSMNVVEMPIGVKVSGSFDTAYGIKVTPAIDFTAVPMVGDKEVDTVIGAVNVLDNLYNTTLGVSASYGPYSFGLNYKYGFGQENRSNNSFNANFRYEF